jgi:cell division control protein 24
MNPYSLAVWWRGDDDLEFFTLRCRSEEQLRQWENQINRLINEVASRRASERNFSQLIAQHNSHASVPAVPVLRPLPYVHDRASSSMSHAQGAHSLPPHPASGLHRVNAYSTSEQVASSSISYSSGYVSSMSSEGFEFDLEDEYEDYPPASLPASGRGTPIGVHRMQSMPIEPRDPVGYDRPLRARTEDINGQVMSQWRSTNGVAPLPPGAGPAVPPSYRPVPSRVNSSASGASFGMDPNFRNSGRPLRVPLHSQVSSSKLKALYDSGGTRSVTASPAMNSSVAPPLTRSRSASQPSAYVPQPVPPPPVPSNAMWPHRSQDSTASSSKRGSGSSQSTGGGSSEESPHSSSPITPFGSSESSLPGSALRSPRSQTFETMTAGGAHLAYSPPVKVKVHFNEDIFVIQVPRCTEYFDLVDKVGRKIRLCGPRRDDTPLRVRYRDEDGDMVSLGSTEDVQMAFESFRPGGQVTLYVT